MYAWTNSFLAAQLPDVTYRASKIGLILERAGERGNLVADTKLRAMSKGAEDLMHRLLIEVQLYHDSEDFLDWCDELGRAPGEFASVTEFERVKANHAALWRLLGTDSLEALIMVMHVGQAVSAARP